MPRSPSKRFVPKPTCTLDIVKDRDAYERFRRLLYDLFALDRNLMTMLDDIAKHFGITRPQHTIIMTVSHLGMKSDVSVQDVADYMQVANPFVAAQSRVLVMKGLLTKEDDHNDRRRTLLLLTRAGERYVEQTTQVIQELNNIVFQPLTPSNFRMVSDVIHAFAATSERALIKARELSLSASPIRRRPRRRG